VRSFTAIVPKIDQSGLANRHKGLTRAGDPDLREALFLTADLARKVDPNLAERYYRLVVQESPDLFPITAASPSTRVQQAISSSGSHCRRTGTPVHRRSAGPGRQGPWRLTLPLNLGSRSGVWGRVGLIPPLP
jgi:hypothetical protein